MRLKLFIKYDGTNYCGWQRQKNALSVQEVLEGALEKTFGEKITVVGCSRTDAGVHARMHVSSFDAETTIPVGKIPLVVNMYLPQDIRAFYCEKAADDFNARFAAKEKTYCYRILNQEHNDPFLSRFVWHYPIALDVDKMRRGAEFIVGEHDFKAFCAAGSCVKTTVREVRELKLEKNENLIEITIRANGYLYNMVRIVAGTLCYVGNGKLEPEDVKKMLEEKKRVLGGITAPPEGLTLEKVVY
ncbi:MAG: tRNA pseudouridine(38-40) synthase TruA [Clostridia bacterium]|nr:tRNA pseudouridine(38-40) synthase TruA [Clostridia bacterium]